MNLSGLQVKIDLSCPPRVRFAGYGLQGTKHLVERYLLPELWALHLYTYRATLELRGEQIALEPGMITLTPPNTEATYRYRGVSEHLCIHFAIDATASDFRHAWLSYPLGEEASVYRDRLESVVQLQPTEPRHADALLWNILWDIVNRRYGSGNADTLPAAITDAIGFIDSRIQQNIKVRDIADHVGYSHNHLTRLFREHLETTVIAFLRSRRMQRARHLLVHSRLPIGDIGRDVGLPDPQQFNKTYRQFFGKSPSAQRRSDEDKAAADVF
ncbi:MAG: helix-turn-helix transcriptional regulator [Planctomycetota bacterium]